MSAGRVIISPFYRALLTVDLGSQLEAGDLMLRSSQSISASDPAVKINSVYMLALL